MLRFFFLLTNILFLLSIVEMMMSWRSHCLSLQTNLIMPISKASVELAVGVTLSLIFPMTQMLQFINLAFSPVKYMQTWMERKVSCKVRFMWFNRCTMDILKSRKTKIPNYNSFKCSPIHSTCLQKNITVWNTCQHSQESPDFPPNVVPCPCAPQLSCALLFLLH